MSFFREGMNEFGSHRYINAFTNFYFFLEGLYGDGKSKNDAVEAAFLHSQQFLSATDHFYTKLHGPGMEENLAGIQSYLKLKHCEDSVGGFIKLLVSMRGTLHHFSVKNTQIKGHPLNQEEFRPIAFLAMGICLGLLPVLMAGEAIS